MANYDKNLFEEKQYDEKLFEDTPYEEELINIPDEQTTGIIPSDTNPTESPYQAPIGTDLPTDRIGALEAFGLGTANTLGPVVGGAAAVAGEAYGNIGQPKPTLENLPVSSEIKQKVKDDPELLKATEDVLKGVKDSQSSKDTFYEGKQHIKDRQKLAMKEQPLSTLVGMGFEGMALGGIGGLVGKSKNLGKFGQLASKVLPNAETGVRTQRIIEAVKKTKDLDKMYKTYNKLKGASRWARFNKLTLEGAKFGGLNSALNGDAKLLEGEAGKTLLDTAVGTAAGAGLGAIMGGVLQVGDMGKDLLKNFSAVVEPYRLGKLQIDLTEKQSNLLVRKMSKALHKDIYEGLKKTGLDEKEAYVQASQFTKRLDTLDKVSDAAITINEMGLPDTDITAKAYANMLNKRMGISAKMSKVREDVKKELTKMYQKDLSLDDQAAARLADKELDRVIKSGGNPSELITQGNISNSEIYPDSKFGNITKKVQATKLEDSVDKAGNIVPGEVKITTADVTPKAPVITQGIDEETGLEFMRILDANKGTDKVFVAGRPIKQLTETGSFEEANEIIQELRPYISGDKVPLPIKQEALKLKNELKAMIDSKIPDTVKGNKTYFNKQYRYLYKAMEDAGFDHQTPKIKGEAYEEQLRAIGKMIERDEKGAFPILDGFLQTMRKYDPKIYEKHIKDINLLKLQMKYKESDLAVAKRSSGKMDAIAGKVLDVLFGLSNKLGKAQSNVTNVAKKVVPAIQSANNKILTSSPEQIKKLITKIENSGSEANKRFLEPLLKLQYSKDRTRQAILFGLMQTTGFRELLEKNDKKDEDGDDK